MKLRIPKFEHTPYTVTHTDITSAAKALTRFLSNKNTKTAILTGAGISTASGLPDYRGPRGTYTTNPNHKPTLYHEFVSNDSLRKRYWSRAWIGYEQALKWARPNVAHGVLSGWLRDGKVAGLITQNVDGLHKLAMTKQSREKENDKRVFENSELLRADVNADSLIELHGSAYRVHCLSCKEKTSREEFQTRMAEDNGWSKEEVFGQRKEKSREFVDPGLGEVQNGSGLGSGDGHKVSEDTNPYLASLSGESGSRDLETSESRDSVLDISGYNLSVPQLNADGDAELDVEMDYDKVVIPECMNCGGVLKPSIVFFGESVPEEDRLKSRELLQSCDQLLVIGTSLSTFSAFDLVRQFYKQGKKVAVLNKGGVRGEGKEWQAEVRLDGDIGGVLERVKF